MVKKARGPRSLMEGYNSNAVTKPLSPRKLFRERVPDRFNRTYLDKNIKVAHMDFPAG